MRPNYSLGAMVLFVLLCSLCAAFVERRYNDPIRQLGRANAGLVPIGYSSIGLCIEYPEVERPDEIEMVSLHDSDCQERHFQLLARLPNLQRLDLRGEFDAKWMHHLSNCQTLKKVILHGPISKRLLQAFGRIDSLESLFLTGTGVAKKTIVEFRSDHPGISVDASQYDEFDSPFDRFWQMTSE